MPRAGPSWAACCSSTEARLWVNGGLRSPPTWGVEADPEQLEDAQQLASELVHMGPTFIKLGQLLSTRSDILPPACLEALAPLRDDVTPFPADDAIKVVE